MQHVPWKQVKLLKQVLTTGLTVHERLLLCDLLQMKLHSVEVGEILGYEGKRGCAITHPPPKKPKQKTTKKPKTFCTRLRHFHSSVHTHTHIHTQTQTHAAKSVFFFLYDKQGWRQTQSAAAGLSARVHAEQLDALRAPVEAHSRVEDQWPDVRDEEVLRLVFLHVFELELWEFLFKQKEEERWGQDAQGTEKKKCWQMLKRGGRFHSKHSDLSYRHSWSQ